MRRGVTGNTQGPDTNGTAARFSVAVVFGAAGAAVAAVIHSHTGEETYTPPLAAVMIVAPIAGLWPAVAAIVVAATGTAVALIDGAPGALSDPGQEDVTRWLVFLGVSVIVVAVGCIARWALTRDAAARRDLEEARARLDLALDAGRMGLWSAHPTTHEFWCGDETRKS